MKRSPLDEGMVPVAKVPRWDTSGSVRGSEVASFVSSSRRPLPPPLHRDALHCVFAFLGHRDISEDRQSTDRDFRHGGVRECVSAAGVCQSWRDAMYSTSLGRAQVRWRSDRHLRQIAASSPPLLRCIDRVAFGSGVMFEDDAALRQWFAGALSNLRHLQCTVSLRDSFSMSSSKALAWNLHLPPHLHTLEIDLRGVNDPTCRDRFCASMVSIVDAGHQLVSLKLYVPHFFHGVSPLSDADPAVLAERFAWVPLLPRLLQLRSFVLTDSRSRPDECEWPNEAIDILRGMTHLTHIDCFGTSQTCWQRLTAEPHALSIQSLPVWSRPSESLWLPEVLRRLPTLTSLQTSGLPLNQHDASILLHLPALRDLQWGEGGPRPRDIPPEMELRACTQLRRLYLSESRLTDRRLCKIMPCLPYLESLTLCQARRIRSLRFLASSSRLRSTLKDLRLLQVFLPGRELLTLTCPVRTLASLESLTLVECIPSWDLARVAPLVDATSAEFMGRACWPNMNRYRSIRPMPYQESDQLPITWEPLDDEEVREDAHAEVEATTVWQTEVRQALAAEEIDLATLAEQTAAASPQVRASRNALHGILSFLGGSGASSSSGGLVECARFAQVSRAWRDAAYTGSSEVGHAHLSLQAYWRTLRRGEPMDSLTAALSSARLRRCIRSVRVGKQFHPVDEERHRQLVADALPHLTQFECFVHIGQRRPELVTPEWSSGRLHLPSRLTKLTVHFDFLPRIPIGDLPEGDEDLTPIHRRLAAVMASVAEQLADSLVDLEIHLFQAVRYQREDEDENDHPPNPDEEEGDRLHHPARVRQTPRDSSFAWVTSIVRLTRLRRFRVVRYDSPEWPTDAIDVLRGLSNLTHLDCFGPSPRVANLRALTREPHSLQLACVMPALDTESSSWESKVGVKWLLTDELAHCLTQLPTLTELWPAYTRTRDTAFLARLPALRRLRLREQRSDEGNLLPLEVALCTQLRVLHLDSTQLGDHHLCRITSRLPHLAELSLTSERVRNLRFLDADIAPHLSCTLTTLTLAECRLDPEPFMREATRTPLAHLHALERLELKRCFGSDSPVVVSSSQADGVTHTLTPTNYLRTMRVMLLQRRQQRHTDRGRTFDHGNTRQPGKRSWRYE